MPLPRRTRPLTRPPPFSSTPHAPPRSSQTKTFSACAPSATSRDSFGRRLCITNGSVSGGAVSFTVQGYANNPTVYPAAGNIVIKLTNRQGQVLLVWSVSPPGANPNKQWTYTPPAQFLKIMPGSGVTNGVAAKVTMKIQFA